jgi:hypothetical protein
MSFSFPPIYQNHIDLWSPFTKLERLPQVETKKVEHVSDNVQVLTLYDKWGRSKEYHYGYSNRSQRV